MHWQLRKGLSPALHIDPVEGKNMAITDSPSAESMNNVWPWVASPVADSSLPEKYRGRFWGLGYRAMVEKV